MSLQEAAAIRLAMEAEGWHSHDKLSDIGWRDGAGYSVWFERYDWHGQNAMRLIGSKACYHAHTPNISEAGAATRRAAALARRAWREYPDIPPSQVVKNELVPGTDMRRLARHNAKYTDKARYSDYTFFRIAILGYLLFKHLQLRVIEKRNIDFSIRF